MRFDEERNVFVADTGLTYEQNEVVFSEIQSKHILLKWAVLTLDGKWISLSALREGVFEYTRLSGASVIKYLQSLGEPTHPFIIKHSRASQPSLAAHSEETVYAEDCGSVLTSQAFYHERTDKFYFNEDNIPTKHIISQYHGTQSNTVDLSEGSEWCVGYEVEKNNFKKLDGKSVRTRGSRVHLHPVFRGYETDSSCGVEAITNILPLTADTSKVFSMFDDAKNILNSPSNTQCGGHINLSVKGLTDKETLEFVSKKVGFIYSIFQERLMTTRTEDLKEGIAGIVKRGNRIEIRLPDAVKNVDDLKWRHKFMFQLMEACSSKESDKETVSRMKPLFTERFGKKASVEALIQAVGFQDFIKGVSISKVPKSILMFVDKDAKREYIEKLARERKDREEKERRQALSGLEAHIKNGGIRRRTMKIGRQSTTTFEGTKYILKLTPNGIAVKNGSGYFATETLLTGVEIYNESAKSRVGITGVMEDGSEIVWKKNTKMANQSHWEAHAVAERAEPINHFPERYWGTIEVVVKNGLLIHKRVRNRKDVPTSYNKNDRFYTVAPYQAARDYESKYLTTMGGRAYLWMSVNEVGVLVSPPKKGMERAEQLGRILVKAGYPASEAKTLLANHFSLIEGALENLPQ